MAYQNVATPRFWVSTLQWLNSLGMITTTTSNDNSLTKKTASDLTYINPINPAIFKNTDINVNDWNIVWKINNSVQWNSVMQNDNNFFMCLGHNFRSTGGGVMHLLRPTVLTNDEEHLGKTPYVNYRGSSDQTNGYRSEYDGFSIGIDNNASDLESSELTFELRGYFDNVDYQIGSILYGNFFDMPHSPDLNLTMTRDYGGTQTLETRGGSTLSNSYWTKQPNWGNGLPAWHLYKQANDNAPELDNLAPLSISGRRVWNLSFSYLQDQDMFPEISNLTNYEHYQPSGTYTHPYTGVQTEYTENAPYYSNSGEAGTHLSGTPRGYALYNFASNSNFISEVLHKTNGALPFVFQPDSSNANPDQFAICMFDQESFQFKQQAPNLYSCSMTIREIW